MSNKNILILYYSLHGKTSELANSIARGVESEDLEAKIRTVPKVVLSTTKISEPEIPIDGPLYASLDDLSNAAGIAVGSPTRFGNMAAPLKYFWDGTSNLWMSGALVDKPAALFCSTASMHGGQESTLLSMMLPLLHHGMIITGIPFTEQNLINTNQGGTPYGASHVAGLKNDNQITDQEKQLAFSLGARLARIAIKLR